MKKVYAFLMFAILIVGGAGLVFWITGCDEIQAPCDEEKTESGMPGFDLKYLESWHKEGSFGILRFIYPDRTIFYVCTDRTVGYEGKLTKRFESTVFTVLPQARLIWKYSAPKPSKAVLTGASGGFTPLFEFNSSTTFSETRISLASSEGLLGGVFVPGVEIKIATRGNQSDDYNYVWNNFMLIFNYKVTYRLWY